MRVLIADDELGIREIVKEYCKSEGYTTIEAANGEEVIRIVESEKVDVIVLDIMMPKMDGLTCYETIKKYNIPTIILSARGEEYDKLLGFNLGVDDYLTKPFSPKELMARIKAVMKRYVTDSFTYESLYVDFDSHVVKIDDEEVKLTPKEFELLAFFINNQNKAIARETLLSKIWGYDFYGDDRTIDTHIKMLRGNLGKYRDLIETVRGVGYKFATK